MTTEGFICISRGIVAHWIWSNPVLFQRWVWMILSANYDDREVSFCYHRIMLHRGQLAVNLSYLSKIWHVSSQATHKFLVKLEDSGMVTRTVDDKVTVITICNYDRYQLKMGASVDGLVDGADNRMVDQVVNQTNKDNKIKTEIEKTSDEVLCQVPLELDMPEAVEKEYISWEKFISFFNTAMRGKTIPKIRGYHLAEHRKRNIRARIREYGKDAVIEVVKKAAASSFLNGGGDKGFVADIDWMMGPRNFPKILDGFYDRRFSENSQNNNPISNNKDNGRIRGTQATATSSEEYSKRF
ncbi:MAG: hypothetical protein E7107_13675 [Prevotella sp.]|jgi:hypothetical protein|nr:hypothetical protein [Prevotella sp.]